MTCDYAVCMNGQTSTGGEIYMSARTPWICYRCMERHDQLIANAHLCVSPLQCTTNRCINNQTERVEKSGVVERRDGQVSASRRSSVAGLYVDCRITCNMKGMIYTVERPSGQMVTDEDHEPSQLFPTTLVMTHCIIHPGGYYTPVTTLGVKKTDSILLRVVIHMNCKYRWNIRHRLKRSRRTSTHDCNAVFKKDE